MSPSPPPPVTTRDPRVCPTVSVVIPALNEEDSLPLVLEGLPPVDEVVIVDGGSADDTVAIAREVRPDAVVVRQTRAGKGNALACGFAACRGDVVVTLNADGSTDPGEIPRYVDALLSGAEVAHGSRFRDGGADLGGRRLDRFGNAVLTWIVNLLFGTSFTDIGFGYNAYWRALLPALDLPPVEPSRSRRGLRHWGDGAEIEPMLNLRTAAQGLRVVEVASIGYPPINGPRERRPFVRALRALRTAFLEYVRRRRFGPRPDPAGGALPATAAWIRPDPSARPGRHTPFPPPDRTLVAPSGRHAAPERR
jgi:glycosyltransferase involved in cell wall biosynthesis